MNKYVEREIEILQRKGFRVEMGKGGRTIIAPNGARYRPSSNFKAVRKWGHDQMMIDRRDRGERRDGGGTDDAHRHSTRFSSRADGVLSHWDRLNHEWQVTIVKEMLHRLGNDGYESAFDALKVLDC